MTAILISAEELAAERAGHRVLAIHAGEQPADAFRSYGAGHLPGAALAYGEIFWRDPEPGEGRRPLPRRPVLQESLRALGLDRTESIVLYDDVSSVYAARAWWVLRNAGFDHVRILDGGWTYWQKHGHPVETTPVLPIRSELRLSGEDRLIALDGDQTEAFPGHGILIDARSEQRFEGWAHPTLDPRGGHVPGAVNAPWEGNVDEDGRFLPPEDLRRRFEALGLGPGVSLANYCGSGVSAVHNIVAQHLAGFTNTALYPGSWSEWAADETRPVETLAGD